MRRSSFTVSSRWQVNQWARIERRVLYDVACRLCNWCDTTSSKREAEELFRNHAKNKHGAS